MFAQPKAISRVRAVAGRSAKLQAAGREVSRIRYRREFGTVEMREGLKRAGVEEGRHLHVQVSWDELFNYTGNTIALLEVLRELVGDTATIAMPAGPGIRLEKLSPDQPWNFDKLPSRMGLITELFRRLDGTERSVHISSSVCAAGPDAAWVCQDHALTDTAWDVGSPFDRLRSLDALQLSIGLYPFYATPLHIVDSTLRHETDFHASLFGPSVEYEWTYRGAVGVHAHLPRIKGTIQAWKLWPYYNRKKFYWGRVSNVRLFAIDIPYLVDRGLELGRDHITHYVSTPLGARFKT